MTKKTKMLEYPVTRVNEGEDVGLVMAKALGQLKKAGFNPATVSLEVRIGVVRQKWHINLR